MFNFEKPCSTAAVLVEINSIMFKIARTFFMFSLACPNKSIKISNRFFLCVTCNLTDLMKSCHSLIAFSFSVSEFTLLVTKLLIVFYPKPTKLSGTTSIKHRFAKKWLFTGCKLLLDKIYRIPYKMFEIVIKIFKTLCTIPCLISSAWILVAHYTQIRNKIDLNVAANDLNIQMMFYV